MVVVPRREEQDWRVITRASPLRTQLEPVGTRQHQVEDDRVMATLDPAPPATQAVVLDRHLVACQAEPPLQQRGDRTVVLDDQEPRHQTGRVGGRGPLSCGNVPGRPGRVPSATGTWRRSRTGVTSPIGTSMRIEVPPPWRAAAS